MIPENSPDPIGSAVPEAPVAPEIVAPEIPQFVSPEAVHANGVVTIPDVTIPDAAIPDASMPDAAIPDAAIPDAAMADVTVPESAVAGNAEAPVWVPAVEPATAAPVSEEMARSTLSEWVITILLLLFLTTFLVQAFVIPTGSMEDTLLIGDHLLVDKLAFSPGGPISKYLLPYTEVKRGDIIVFRYPTDISQTFVKRCMGVPGDHIRIVNKQVYLNGHLLVEPYKYNKTDYIDSYRDNFPGEPNVTLERGAIEMMQNNIVDGEVVVPPGSYFAMGDNRDSSWDSRYWGFVPRQNIIGKPLIIYWSYDRPTDQLNTNSVTLPQLLDLVEHFFGKTRWRRAFQLIHGYPVK